MDIHIVFDNPKDVEKIKQADFNSPAFFHFIDMNTRDGKTLGFKLKGSWGARLNPFVALSDKDKVFKCFYAETGNNPIDELIAYLKNQ